MNIWKEGDDMSNYFDSLTEMERDMEREYAILDGINRTPEQEERFNKLSIILGYKTPKRNPDIECEGCGS